MSPTHGIEHQRVSNNIAWELEEALTECEECMALLPVDWKIAEDTVVQPDNASSERAVFVENHAYFYEFFRASGRGLSIISMTSRILCVMPIEPPGGTNSTLAVRWELQRLHRGSKAKRQRRRTTGVDVFWGGVKSLFAAFAHFTLFYLMLVKRSEHCNAGV